MRSGACRCQVQVPGSDAQRPGPLGHYPLLVSCNANRNTITEASWCKVTGLAGKWLDKTEKKLDNVPM